MVLWVDKHAKYEARRRGDAVLLERKRAARRKHHAENAERLNAARIARAKADPAPRVAAQKRYDDAHREERREAVRRHGQSARGRQLHAERSRKRRARARNAFVETVDASVVLTRSNGCCGICGELVDPSDFHVDHVVPLARGGEHSYANVQAAHPLCNIRKRDRLPEEVSELA